MTYDTYDDLSAYIGKPIPNYVWKQLISESFGVSKSVAKEMLHAMYAVREMKAGRDED